MFAYFMSFVMLGIAVETASAAPLRLAEDKATLYDDAGLPLLVGTEQYIFRLARNPSRRVMKEEAARVRISHDGARGLWLQCAELKAPACGKKEAPRTRGFSLPKSGGRQMDDVAGTGSATQNRVPTCPGDPRCPQ